MSTPPPYLNLVPHYDDMQYQAGVGMTREESARERYRNKRWWKRVKVWQLGIMVLGGVALAVKLWISLS